MPSIAAIQMTSTTNLQQNLQTAAKLIQQAATQGAQLIVLPENFALMSKTEADKLTIREPAGAGIIQQFLAEQARQHTIWLVGGTIALATDNPEKVRAAVLVFDPHGHCVARYDKIHLFDACLTATEEYKESNSTEPGDKVIVIDTPLGRLGLAVCYDLRFPELFRLMLQKKAEIIALPTAFAFTTGQAHWETLARARAIENFCFFIGACQTGTHENGRQTYGHSIIIHPWGNILACLPQGEGVVAAEINKAEQTQLRQRIPVTQHQRINITDIG